MSHFEGRQIGLVKDQATVINGVEVENMDAETLQKVLEQEQPDRPKHWTLPAGRIDKGEQPLEAAKRETLEETGLDIKDFKLISVIENFYTNGDQKMQEISFVYLTPKVDAVAPEFGLVEVTKEDMKNIDIKPAILKQLITDERTGEITHWII